MRMSCLCKVEMMQDSSLFSLVGGARSGLSVDRRALDDATSRLWARLVEHDTTEENMRTLWGWLQRYGRPLAHYTDKNSIFRHRNGVAALQEQLR